MESTVLDFVRELRKASSSATASVFEDNSILNQLPKSYEDVCDVRIIGGFVAVFCPFSEQFLNFAHEHNAVFFKDHNDCYASAWFFSREMEFEIKEFLHNKCYIKLDSDPVDFKPEIVIDNEIRQHFIKYPMLNFDVLTETFKAFKNSEREFYLNQKKDILFIKAPIDSSFSQQANKFYGIYVSELGAWAFNYILFRQELGIAYKQFKDSTKIGAAA